MIAKFPQEFFESSSAGIIKEKNDAESMMPDAVPTAILFIVFDDDLKKKMRIAPSVVAMNGKVKDKASVVCCMFFLQTAVCSSIINLWRKKFFCERFKDLYGFKKS